MLCFRLCVSWLTAKIREEMDATVTRREFDGESLFLVYTAAIDWVFSSYDFLSCLVLAWGVKPRLGRDLRDPWEFFTP